MAIGEKAQKKPDTFVTGAEALQQIIQALNDAADYMSAVDSARAIHQGKDSRRSMGDRENVVSPLAEKLYAAQQIAQALMGTMISAEGEVRLRTYG